jgi:8-oxo-dGTP diphosphatase
MLLSQRLYGKPMAGYWEFPGGKVRQGELVLDALKRELMEELGIKVVSAKPWCGIDYTYPHARVRLHFYIVRKWRGEVVSLEGNSLLWQEKIAIKPLLPTLVPLIEWLEQL